MKQKIKTRKAGIRVKLLVPVMLLLFVACMAIGIMSNWRLQTSLVEMGVEQAEMAAQVAMDVVDVKVSQQLEPGCESTVQYQTMLASLRAVQEKYGILYLYTLYTDGTTVYYGVDTDRSELQAYYGQEHESTYDDLKTVFAGEDYAQEYIEENEYGTLISVFKPIKNAAGEVVGVLGSDYDATDIQAKIDQSKIEAGIMAFVCVAVVGLLMGITINRIIIGLQAVNQKVYDLVHNEGDLTQKLDIKTGDELELIANNINKLLEHIRGIMLNIADNSVQLNQSSKNMVDNLSSAEVSITDVSATMQEMSAAMEETSASLNQVNESIRLVYEAVESISGSADDGKTSSHEIMAKAADIYKKAVTEQENARNLAQEMAGVVNEKIENGEAVISGSFTAEEVQELANKINGGALPFKLETASFSTISPTLGTGARDAMALAGDPKLIIADEPTTALDVTIQAQILELLKDIQKKTGCAIMLITHDLGVIAEMADEVVVMYAGKVIERGTVRDIFHNPLHPYTIGLQKSKPLITADSNEPLYSIPGQVPNPINLPNTCYFKNRCRKCIHKCDGAYPHEVKVSDTHYVACYLYDEEV